VKGVIAGGSTCLRRWSRSFLPAGAVVKVRVAVGAVWFGWRGSNRCELARKPVSGSHQR